MMMQTLQGKVLPPSCGRSNVQQVYPQGNLGVCPLLSQSDLEMLQLQNMDPNNSPVRRIVRNNIIMYLKEYEGFRNWKPDQLEEFSWVIDEQLFKEADLEIQYMDLGTINVRMDALLKSGSLDDSINNCLSSATSSILKSELLPKIEAPVLRTNHGRPAPGSTNLSSCARESSTPLAVDGNTFTSQRYVPNEHHRISAKFSGASSDRIIRGSESLTNTIFAPCTPLLPKCTSGLGGSPGVGMDNGHTKEHSPGDTNQIDSWQASISGSYSSLSAACGPTTSSTAMRTFSTDSVSTTNARKLSSGSNPYSLGQESSSPQDGRCKKELEYPRSQPLEQSDQSGITTGCHQYILEHDILCLYDHTINCPYLIGDCELGSCTSMKQKLEYILNCKGSCRDDCSKLSELFIHYRSCSLAECYRCGPVRERVLRAREQTSNSTASKPTSPTLDESSGKHRPVKRLKVDVPNLDHVNQSECPEKQHPVVDATHQSAEAVCSELIEIPRKSPSYNSLGGNDTETKNELEMASEDVHNKEILTPSETAVETEKESHYEDWDIEMKDSKVDPLLVQTSGAKFSVRKKKAASILYAFTAQELRNHLRSLKQHNCQSKVTAEESLLDEGLPDQNTCSLCGMERLLFEPPPLFCALCFKIINSTGFYYVEVENGNDKASICSRCHHITNAKAKYEKRFNYTETDAEAEWWVQCDKCKAWQHQICALFNPKIVEAEAEYTCAKCFLKEKESGEINLLGSSTVLGAQELPRTKLSDHIEQRLSMRLEHDRQQRAITSGKSIEEVPGVEDLTVRVVSSADRLLQVQSRFLEFFKQENYPEVFPYKSKAILLFQKIEGVDVCLFAMYVQEYGSDCPLPNQRHVYLAYIDSVKYFRPEIKSASGEALRTFVYHEILIGYLDYCKKRGFVSCSIWACPSTKRDDYVLYCHPTTQKMPKSDKLRGWYQHLIKKAVKEGVVVERNTLYDFFLQPTNECKANISAACLPYCENDFWPGEAERLLEKKDDNISQKKETQLGRLLRVAKRDERKGNLEDILLVHRLGERMRTMKEDFIMLCLQQFCKHCHHPIVSGKSWVCTSCKNFHLCDQCYAEEQNSPQKDRHPSTTKQKHVFQRVEESPLSETDDGDPTMESKYFDSRTDFLKHCQDNQYQFDTLRRAKHSTMMILYHLHDSACSACHCAMDQCLAWRCPMCQGCSFCDSCYKRGGEYLHVHKLVQTLQHHMQQKRNVQVYLDGLIHASRCFDPRSCSSRICVLLKKLFFHGVRCVVRARNRGGCFKCVFMWKLLITHAKACEDMDCLVPRCRDIKTYMADKNKLCGS